MKKLSIFVIIVAMGVIFYGFNRLISGHPSPAQVGNLTTTGHESPSSRMPSDNHPTPGIVLTIEDHIRQHPLVLGTNYVYPGSLEVFVPIDTTKASALSMARRIAHYMAKNYPHLDHDDLYSIDIYTSTRDPTAITGGGYDEDVLLFSVSTGQDDACGENESNCASTDYHWHIWSEGHDYIR